MLSISLVLSDLSSSPAGSLITCPVTEVLSRLSVPVTGLIVPSGMEVLPSFVLVPQQETQTFYHAGVPACEDMHGPTFTLCSGSAFWTARWSDVDKPMLLNTYVVPKHETKWTCLVGMWSVVTWRSLLVSCLFECVFHEVDLISNR